MRRTVFALGTQILREVYGCMSKVYTVRTGSQSALIFPTTHLHVNKVIIERSPRAAETADQWYLKKISSPLEFYVLMSPSAGF